MKNIYVHVFKKKFRVHRTVDLGNGVHIDVNNRVGIVGVEILDAKSVQRNGKKI